MFLPLEIWTEISKGLPVQDLKKLRLSSRLLYIASTAQFYDKCNITLFLESARNGCIETLIQIYNHCKRHNKHNILIQHLFPSFEEPYNPHLSCSDYYSLFEDPHSQMPDVFEDVCKPYYPFQLAAENGHLNIIKQLYDWVESDEEKLAMITTDGSFAAFDAASDNGHLNIIRQLYDWVESDKKKLAAMIKGCRYIFQQAAGRGYLNIIKQLYDCVESDKEKQAMITSDGYHPFKLAAAYGHLNIIQQLNDWVESDEEKVAMIAGGFKYAVENGHFEIAQRLLDWSSEEEKTFIMEKVGRNLNSLFQSQLSKNITLT